MEVNESDKFEVKIKREDEIQRATFVPAKIAFWIHR